MTVRKAIDTLESLKRTIPETDQQEKIWLTQARSYIQSLFGHNSHEYSFIVSFSFHDSVKKVSDFWADTYKAYDPNPNRPKIDHKLSASSFLDKCIETLKVKGLYKEPTTNILSRLSDTAIWTIIGVGAPSLISIGLFFGNLYSDKQNLELRQVNKELRDSLSSIRISTLPNSNPISNADTNESQQKNHK